MDCCSSGIGHGGEGNGVTELMSACAFDIQANGVGHYSFTKALTTELRLLSRKGSFPVVELYTRVYCRAQHHMAQGLPNERYPAPIHLVLTRDDLFPRSIQLSIQNRLPTQNSPQPTGLSDESPEPAGTLSYNRPFSHEADDLAASHPSSNSKDLSSPAEVSIPTSSDSKAPQADGVSGVPKLPKSIEDGTSRPVSSQTTTSNLSTSLETYSRDSPWPADAPRLLFAVRLADDIQAEDLSPEYFANWLRIIPAVAKDIRVEGGFKCDSTLVLVTLPLLIWPYLTHNPAIVCLGPVKSSNLLLPSKQPQDSAETKANIDPIQHLSRLPGTDLYEFLDSDSESSASCATPKRPTSPDILSIAFVDPPDKDEGENSMDEPKDDSSLHTLTPIPRIVDSLQDSTTSVLGDFGPNEFKNIYSARLNLYRASNLNQEESRLEESVSNSSSSVASSRSFTSSGSVASSVISGRYSNPWSTVDSRSMYASTQYTVPSARLSRRGSLTEFSAVGRFPIKNIGRREACWSCVYLRKTVSNIDNSVVR